MSTPEHSDTTGLILSFMDSIRREMQSELPEACSFMHVKALDFISREKSPSMRDIAEFLRITSPGATMIVDKLVENGELDRKADPADRRVVRLVVTTKGRVTLETGMKVIKKLIAKRLSSLSRIEQIRFASILEKLIKTN